MINILLSQLISILTGILGQNGVTVPTSDFSIHQPSALAVIVQFSYVVIIAPIVEEFIYRGAILTALSPYGRGAAVLFSALEFDLCTEISLRRLRHSAQDLFTLLSPQSVRLDTANSYNTLSKQSACKLSSISDAIGLEHYETFVMSVAEIVIGLVGFMVLFTSLKKLLIDDSENVLTPKRVPQICFHKPCHNSLYALPYHTDSKEPCPGKQLKITTKNG